MIIPDRYIPQSVDEDETASMAAGLDDDFLKFCFSEPELALQMLGALVRWNAAIAESEGMELFALSALAQKILSEDNFDDISSQELAIAYLENYRSFENFPDKDRLHDELVAGFDALVDKIGFAMESRMPGIIQEHLGWVKLAYLVQAGRVRTNEEIQWKDYNGILHTRITVSFPVLSAVLRHVGIDKLWVAIFASSNLLDLEQTISNQHGQVTFVRVSPTEWKLSEVKVDEN